MFLIGFGDGLMNNMFSKWKKKIIRPSLQSGTSSSNLPEQLREMEFDNREVLKEQE